MFLGVSNVFIGTDGRQDSVALLCIQSRVFFDYNNQLGINLWLQRCLVKIEGGKRE
jgi:hypothetical protein